MDQPSSISKRILHIIRIAYYMLRKGLFKHKTMMDLHLLFKRGKIAGKSLTKLLTFHHNHNNHHPSIPSNLYSAFTCRYVDPNASFYNPTQIEFSCSNTPSYPSLYALTHKRKKRDKNYYEYDVETVAKAFEILNREIGPNYDPESPGSHRILSPVGPRQLRITDSPSWSVQDGESDLDHKVDRHAEEFIKNFYEQLRVQQLHVSPSPAATTPECYWANSNSYLVGRLERI